MKNIIKIFLSILFFLCLLNMPYGYYQFVRLIALTGFAVLAYIAYSEENNTGMIVYIALAVLFQPFAKIALGRTAWNAIDIIVGTALNVSVFSTVIKNKDK